MIFRIYIPGLNFRCPCPVWRNSSFLGKAPEARLRGYKTFSMLNSAEHEISTAHNTKIPRKKEVSCFKSLRCIYPADECYNPNYCWHFNIYEQDKFRAQLS